MTDYTDLIADLRSRINPAYAGQIGTESHERKMCADALEQLLAERDELVAGITRMIGRFDRFEVPFTLAELPRQEIRN